jgi:hypothetical protein
MNLFEDVFSKLKTTSDKLERKEQSDGNRKNYAELCRMCQNSMRSAEVVSAKESIGQQ